jgi:hypothetical protein
MSFVSLLDPLGVAVKFTFLDNLGYEPYEWQSTSIQHILSIAVKGRRGAATPVLLVQPTGGGKSSVRDVCALLLGGCCLTIVPLLSLAADQTEKNNKLKEKDPRISVFNLDDLQDKTTNDELRRQLANMDANADGTVFLFSSPQKIANNPEWQDTIKTMVSKGIIRFIAVDECHLYASHGVEFRTEFRSMKPLLFDLVSNSGTATHVPMLFMTATATASIVDDMEKLSGLVFNKSNDVLWPSSCKDFSRRNVGIQLTFNNSPLQKIKTVVKQVCGNGRDLQLEKIIVYTNSKTRCRDLKRKVSDFLNVQGIQADVVVVHGDLYKEQKSHNIRLFVGKDLTENVSDEGRMVDLVFQPRILVATAGAANAGLDSHLVRVVVRDGFPTSVQDLIQELGRAGRWDGASPSTDSYWLVVSLKSFSSILFRIYIVPEINKRKAAEKTEREKAIAEENNSLSVTETLADTVAAASHVDPVANLINLPLPELQARQFKNLIEVTGIVCLDPGKCIHYKLEHRLVNPFVAERILDNDDPWRKCNCCWQCTNSSAKVFLDMAVHREALRDCLLDIFVINEMPIEARALFKNAIVKTLSLYKKDNKHFTEIVFGNYRKSQVEAECRYLVLKLFACGVFVPAVDGTRLYCKLAFGSEGQYVATTQQGFDGFTFL